MRCPRCNSDTTVYDTITTEHCIWRRRECLTCRHRFVTDERRTKMAPPSRARKAVA